MRDVGLEEANWNGFHVEDVERLCRDVLPAHPTLEQVSIDVPPPFVGLLASSIQADTGSPLRKLVIRSPIDTDSVRAVADMIRRNVPLAHLQLDHWRKLKADEGRRIFQTVASGNTNLRVLQLGVEETFDDTLDHVVAASTSSVRELSIAVRDVSDTFLACLATQLKTNTTMERLCVHAERGRPSLRQCSQSFRYIEEALRTYNYTLREVSWLFTLPWSVKERQERNILTHLVRRNGRIRCAIKTLEPVNYNVGGPAGGVWPHALGLVSPIPTLVYRFLRRGNVDALCGIVLPEGGSLALIVKRKRGCAQRAVPGGPGTSVVRSRRTSYLGWAGPS